MISLIYAILFLFYFIFINNFFFSINRLLKKKKKIRKFLKFIQNEILRENKELKIRYKRISQLLFKQRQLFLIYYNLEKRENDFII